MPDFWMDVDVALAEVPVNLLSLLDDVDFKTVEDSIAYNAAGMDLRWNFVTPGGAMTSTPVTPTTGGAHDWTHQGDGLYTLEIPATSGTINNDTEGFGWFSGRITGVLPFRGPTIGFRAAALNDAFIEGGDRLDVNVEEINDSTAAAQRLALSAAQIIPGTVDTATNTHTPTTTEFQADDITEATADHFNGRIVIFTSGALLGQATDITDYVAVGGIGQFTVTALTEAPANNDTFIIV